MQPVPPRNERPTTISDEPLSAEPVGESRAFPPPGVGPGPEYEREYRRGYQAPPDDDTDPFVAPEPAAHLALADEPADNAEDAEDRAAEPELADEPADVPEEVEDRAADPELADEPTDTAATEPAEPLTELPTDVVVAAAAPAEPPVEPAAETTAETPIEVPADVVVAAVAPAALPGAVAEQPLIAEAEMAGLRSRWRDIQSGFVDDPDQAVRLAAELVDEVVQTLTGTLADARRDLDDWAGDEPPTEQRRVVLRRYRALFNRLLAD
jgi:hypothetical protein